MRPINIGPLLEDGQDLGLLPRKKAVDWVPARRVIIERFARSPALLPVPHPATIDLQHRARSGLGPATLNRPLDKFEQPCLVGP